MSEFGRATMTGITGIVISMIEITIKPVPAGPMGRV